MAGVDGACGGRCEKTRARERLEDLLNRLGAWPGGGDYESHAKVDGAEFSDEAGDEQEGVELQYTSTGIRIGRDVMKPWLAVQDTSEDVVGEQGGPIGPRKLSRQHSDNGPLIVFMFG